MDCPQPETAWGDSLRRHRQCLTQNKMRCRSWNKLGSHTLCQPWCRFCLEFPSPKLEMVGPKAQSVSGPSLSIEREGFGGSTEWSPPPPGFRIWGAPRCSVAYLSHPFKTPNSLLLFAPCGPCTQEPCGINILKSSWKWAQKGDICACFKVSRCLPPQPFPSHICGLTDRQTDWSQ